MGGKITHKDLIYIWSPALVSGYDKCNGPKNNVIVHVHSLHGFLTVFDTLLTFL